MGELSLLFSRMVNIFGVVSGGFTSIGDVCGSHLDLGSSGGRTQ